MQEHAAKRYPLKEQRNFQRIFLDSETKRAGHMGTGFLPLLLSKFVELVLFDSVFLWFCVVQPIKQPIKLSVNRELLAEMADRKFWMLMWEGKVDKEIESLRENVRNSRLLYVYY